MRFAVLYPIFGSGYAPELLAPREARQVLAAIEDSGFDGVAFTDHPAPPHAWLSSGGHDSLDPLTALAFAAAVTDRIRLITFLLVLPYRNPLLAAKQAATVDVLSGGRLTLAAGVGYLRSEFTALGVDFDERNELFDEAVEVLRAAWSNEELSYQGRHFSTRGQILRPHPVQGRPPIWVGGNSRRARLRAATVAEGWAPLLTDPATAKVIKTSAITTIDQLRDGIREVRELAERDGRDPDALDFPVQMLPSNLDELGTAEADDRWCAQVEQLREAGVTWLLVEPPAVGVRRCVEVLERVGAELLPKLR